MRILISGGGIAGLTLAYWLHRYGFEPVVIEQADGILRDGYALDSFGTGYDVAERMGLIDRLQIGRIPLEYVAYVNGSGQPISKLAIALMHWTLEEALHEALTNEVEVRFGRSLVAVQQGPEDVKVSYDDGTRDSIGEHGLTVH